MFRRLFRGFFPVLGGLIGYEAFELSRYMLEKAGGSVVEGGISQSEQLWIGIFFVFIFRLSPFGEYLSSLGDFRRPCP